MPGLLVVVLAHVGTLRPVQPAAAHSRRLRQGARRAAVIDGYFEVDNDDLYSGNDVIKPSYQ